MKRIIIPIMTILALAFPQNAGADVVPESRARAVAENFLGASQTRAGSGKLTLLWDGEDTQTRSSNPAPAFFIYSREGGGFVIVAGDDVAHPILGYSYSDSFSVTDMPDNLEGWLTYIRESIDDVRRAGSLRTYEVANEWVKAQAKTRAGDTIPAEKLWETAKFDQGNPFNKYCPLKRYAGCTNVSIGILMKFYNYPDRLFEEIPGFTDGNNNLVPTVKTHKIKWDKIRMSYKSGEYTDEEAEAVSRLLMDIATLSKSSFGKSGTGADYNTAVRGIIKHFHYDKNASRHNRTNYTVNEYRKLLRSELCQRPIGYTFWTKAGDGHAIVYDGYDANDNFHINFGWGGASNGYYCTDITSTTSPKSFAYDHQAYFNIYPDNGGQGSSQYFASGRLSVTSAGTPIKGKQFTVTMRIGCNSFINEESTSEFAVGLCDKEGELLQILSKPITKTITRNYSTILTNTPCQFDCDLQFGDQLRSFYRDNESQEWQQVVYDKDISMAQRIGEYHLTDTLTLATRTALSYDKETGNYSVNCNSRPDMFIYDSAGNEVTEGFTYRYGKAIVESRKLAPGKYRFVMSEPNYRDTCVFTFTVN